MRNVGQRRSFLYSLTALVLLHVGCAAEPIELVELGDREDGEDTTARDEVLGADPDLIPMEEASGLAAGFLARKAAASRGRQVAESHVERDGDVPVLYVFNFTEGGFAVVSADRRQPPILAYAEEGAFDMAALREAALPGGVAEWMDHARESTRGLRSGTLAAPSSHEPPERLTDDVTQGLVVGGGPGCTDYYEYSKLLNVQTRWHQGCGYNDEAPTASGGPCGRAWAGCVAVAMGQIMKYHRYPGGYDWAAMPDSSGSAETSRLLRSVGDRVGMHYGASGSGASMSDVDDALEDLGYSTSARLVDFSFSTVKQEIDANRPVIMSGTRDCDFLGFPTCGGHAWVVDGYEENYYCETRYLYQYLHVNWGWKGEGASSYDGWYHPYRLNPGGANYNYHQELIVGIAP
ncbi:C10 family peptidase [Sorangium sp. So ce131]|uniref:C10 family peptidase n=1 Tax=Sorangium sp. So ce131 TaxID=3133282 RepID=UPI003F5DBEEB